MGGAVTLTDVANLAGVSQPTASRVLNGSKRTPAPAVVEAVRRAAEELGYIPNAQAQALARASTGLLGLVVQDIADPYFSTIAAGVQQASTQARRHMMIAATVRDPTLEVAAVETFIAHRTDLIVIAGSRWTGPEAAGMAKRLESGLLRYRRNGGRIAVIGQSIPGAHAVIPANRQGSAALAKALVGNGLRNFVVLGGPKRLRAAADRVAGFAAGLAKEGIAAPPVVHGDFTRDGGYEASRQAIAEHARPDVPVCLFAVNDVMALGAMAALREAGRQVPADVQVAGFDDIPTLRDFSPALTTVRIPLYEMGVRAVEMALGGSSDDPLTERVPGEVVLRESTENPYRDASAEPATTTHEQPGGTFS